MFQLDTIFQQKTLLLTLISLQVERKNPGAKFPWKELYEKYDIGVGTMKVISKHL